MLFSIIKRKGSIYDKRNAGNSNQQYEYFKEDIFFFFSIPFPLLFLSLLCYSFMVVVAGGGDEI